MNFEAIFKVVPGFSNKVIIGGKGREIRGMVQTAL